MCNEHVCYTELLVSVMLQQEAVVQVFLLQLLSGIQMRYVQMSFLRTTLIQCASMCFNVLFPSKVMFFLEPTHGQVRIVVRKYQMQTLLQFRITCNTFGIVMATLILLVQSAVVWKFMPFIEGTCISDYFAGKIIYGGCIIPERCLY